VKLAGGGKGKCRRKRAPCHSSEVPVRLSPHRPLTATIVPSPGARALCFS